ncbi:MAG: DUF6807 family protein [Planctomycetota bacterium]|jgi:hypothetical protein
MYKTFKILSPDTLTLTSTIWLTFFLPAAANVTPHVKGIIPKDWPTNTAAPVVVPLSLELSESQSLTAHLTIEGQPKPLQIPAQYEVGDPIMGTEARVWLFFKTDKIHLGKTINIRFLTNDKQTDSGYRSRYIDPSLHITTQDLKPILSYWHGEPEAGHRYMLNDFIHPLIGLDGEVLTDAFPKDHHHHRGIFWAWVRHEIAGKKIGDWWHPRFIKAEQGKIDFGDGPVFSHFRAGHYWVNQPKGGKNAKRFINEQVRCRVFETTSTGRAIDVDLTLSALVDGVRIGGTLSLNKGYGGFTIRFNRAKNIVIEADGRIVEDAVVNHLRAHWVDWSGVFSSNKRDVSSTQPGTSPKPSGTAFFVHPSHPDFPPEWITRKYGILNVSYPGLSMLGLSKGKPLQLHYRIWVHRGDAKQGRVADHYRAYAADWKWFPVTGKQVGKD